MSFHGSSFNTQDFLGFAADRGISSLLDNPFASLADLAVAQVAPTPTSQELGFQGQVPQQLARNLSNVETQTLTETNPFSPTNNFIRDNQGMILVIAGVALVALVVASKVLK